MRSVSDTQPRVTQPSIESDIEHDSKLDVNKDDTVQHDASVYVNPPLTDLETKMNANFSDAGKREPKTVQATSMLSKTDVSKSVREELPLDPISGSKPASSKKKRATSVDHATTEPRECDFQSSKSHARPKAFSVINTDDQKSPVQLKTGETNAKPVSIEVTLYRWDG